jgi:hypothetical protein
VVGIDGRPVYDSLIQPENPIIDYNTRFSGLTDRDFRRSEKDKSSNATSSVFGPPVKVCIFIIIKPWLGTENKKVNTYVHKLQVINPDLLSSISRRLFIAKFKVLERSAE